MTDKTEPTSGAYFAPDARPLWKRLLSRLFPMRQPEIPEDLDGWAPSYMQTHVVWHADWSDRLRVLVSGKLHVQTNTKTDVNVARMQSWSTVYVEPPFGR